MTKALVLSPKAKLLSVYGVITVVSITTVANIASYIANGGFVGNNLEGFSQDLISIIGSNLLLVVFLLSYAFLQKKKDNLYSTSLAAISGLSTYVALSWLFSISYSFLSLQDLPTFWWSMYLPALIALLVALLVTRSVTLGKRPDKIIAAANSLFFAVTVGVPVFGILTSFNRDNIVWTDYFDISGIIYLYLPAVLTVVLLVVGYQVMKSNKKYDYSVLSLAVALSMLLAMAIGQLANFTNNYQLFTNVVVLVGYGIGVVYYVLYMRSALKLK